MRHYTVIRRKKIGTCFSPRSSLVIDPAGPPLQKGGWLKNLRDIGDQSRELPRRMLQLRPRASFRSSQLRLRNLFPYYSHRASFHEESPAPQAAPSSHGGSAGTFLEDPHLFLQKNSNQGEADASRTRLGGDSKSCTDLQRMDPDSPVSLSETFSSEIFLELARCRVPVCDLNSNVRCANSSEEECNCDDEVSSHGSSPGARERTLYQTAAGDLSEDCVSSCSADDEELLGSGSSCWGQPAAER
jgi:hypothetical protein